jgi:hypothetical protein
MLLFIYLFYLIKLDIFELSKKKKKTKTIFYILEVQKIFLNYFKNKFIFYFYLYYFKHISVSSMSIFCSRILKKYN